MGGVNIQGLQVLLDHKTVAMPQRYSHLAPEQLQNAVKLLDGVIGDRHQMNRQKEKAGPFLTLPFLIDNWISAYFLNFLLIKGTIPTILEPSRSMVVGSGIEGVAVPAVPAVKA
jgi:hypothetical protein